jgi:hypothetical protein
VLEESPQILFDIENASLLLMRTLLTVHGSFRNQCPQMKGMTVFDDTSRIGRAIGNANRPYRERGDATPNESENRILTHLRKNLFAVPYHCRNTHGVPAAARNGTLFRKDCGSLSRPRTSAVDCV